MSPLRMVQTVKGCGESEKKIAEDTDPNNQKPPVGETVYLNLVQMKRNLERL